MQLDFSLFDAIDIPIFVIGREASGSITYRYCNSASYALTGQSPESMIGRTAVEVFGERLGRNIAARHEDALNSNQRFSYDVTLPATMGEGVVHNTMTPVEGHPGFAICATRPGGSRLAHARDLMRKSREMEREMELACKALSLRGPMRKYGMLVEEVKRDFKDLGNGKLSMIEEMGRLGEEAYGLVRQVLSYTRAVAAGPVQLERVDFSEFCETLFATFDPDAQHRLFAEERQIFVEPAVLWFVLHELLTEGLADGMLHDFSVRCTRSDNAMLKVAVGCSAPVPEDMRPQDCAFPEIESVLRSRGGKFVPEFDAGTRQCSFLIPGRVIETGEVARGEAKNKTAPPIDGAV